MSVHFSKLTLFLPLVYDTAWHPQLNVFSLCQKDVIGCPAHIPAVYVGSAEATSRRRMFLAGLTRGCKRFLELAYTKHSVLKKCVQPKTKLGTLTVIFLKNSPALVYLKFCLSNSVQA